MSHSITVETPPITDIAFRKPTKADGAAVWRLVQDVGVLDTNSSYLYLLLCHEFSDTCILAHQGDHLVGMVVGLVLPKKPDTYFLWQVGVLDVARGKGLAGAMTQRILKRTELKHVRFLETTVTPSNAASRRFFEKMAANMDTQLIISEGYPAENFPLTQQHESEDLIRIGPFQVASQA